ncbi:MAG: RNA polymerase sigma factor [Selenomonadaceae bacterium]|nr:RNA polymerase sigma factor [Selenomonadaceae bacterium]
MNIKIITSGKKRTDPWGQLAVKAIHDEQAFTELYEYFFPRVYQYLLKKTQDSHLADEMVESAFVRMYQHLSQYVPEKGAFSTWLFRIAQNVLNKHYGSKAVTMHTAWEETFDPVAPEKETPEEQALTKERSRELRDAIMKLPPRQRQILEMTYWLDMKSADIAEQLGMAPSSVRVALKQARDALRKLFAKKNCSLWKRR